MDVVLFGGNTDMGFRIRYQSDLFTFSAAGSDLAEMLIVVLLF